LITEVSVMDYCRKKY